MFLAKASLIVMKFFSDFDILQPAIVRCPVCRKYLTQWSFSKKACEGHNQRHAPNLYFTFSLAGNAFNTLKLIRFNYMFFLHEHCALWVAASMFQKVLKQEQILLYLRLSQLVIVMGEPEIKPPTVDVHGLSQDGASHGRTFNMPARPSLLQ